MALSDDPALCKMGLLHEAEPVSTGGGESMPSRGHPCEAQEAVTRAVSTSNRVPADSSSDDTDAGSSVNDDASSTGSPAP